MKKYLLLYAILTLFSAQAAWGQNSESLYVRAQAIFARKDFNEEYIYVDRVGIYPIRKKISVELYLNMIIETLDPQLSINKFEYNVTQLCLITLYELCENSPYCKPKNIKNTMALNRALEHKNEVFDYFYDYPDKNKLNDYGVNDSYPYKVYVETRVQISKLVEIYEEIRSQMDTLKKRQNEDNDIIESSIKKAMGSHSHLDSTHKTPQISSFLTTKEELTLTPLSIDNEHYMEKLMPLSINKEHHSTSIEGRIRKFFSFFLGKNIITENLESTLIDSLEQNLLVDKKLLEIITNQLIEEKNISKQKEALLKTQNQLLEQERTAKNYYAFSAFVFVILSVLAIYFFIRQRRTNEKLKNLQKFQEEQSAMIVHDFGNPLNIILNQAQSATPDWTRVHKAAQRIENLRHTILDIQRFKNQEIDLQIASHSLAEVFTEVFSLFEEKIFSQSLVVRQNLSSPDLCAVFDRKIIERVLDNLLNNALKHTQKGTITLSAEPNPADPQQVRIALSDTGKGISPSRLKEIFKAHTSFDGSTGLGLTFCQLAIEAHHSQLLAESEEGVGTRFYFDMPLGTPDQMGYSALAPSEEFVLRLSDSEKNKIQTTLLALEKLEFYQYSMIEDCLETLDTSTAALQKYKAELKTALENAWKERFWEGVQKGKL